MLDAMDSDAAALREALALLGDWESELEVLLAPPATPPPGTLPSAPLSQSPQPKSKSTSSVKRPRPSGPAAPTEYRLRRDARKAKLALLQDEARRLQDLLEQEQARIARRAAATRSPLALECEEMAGRQKRQRLLAQEQNAALRGVLAVQLELTRRMRKVSDKASWLGGATGETRLRAALSMGLFNGPTIGIPQHVRHLDSRMDEAGVVLSSGVFESNRGRDFQQVSFRDLGFDGLQVEFAISWVVPFDVGSVERALWAHMTCTKHRERATDHQFTHSASDLMCSRFVSEPRSGDQPNCNHGQPIPGVTHGQAAVRRYEPRHDGTRVVMTHIRARILHEDGKHKGDMHGDGWFQVEPVEGSKTALTPYASRIKWCRRVTGRPVDHDAATSTERARWVHSVVTGPMRRYWERSLSLNMASIENTLLS